VVFDVEKLTEFAMQAITVFASNHADETFYAFAIDADLLCLNSVEQFRITLSEYQNGPYGKKFVTADQIAGLRANTGDWRYQGFARFDGHPGFHAELYDQHYDIGVDDPSDPRLVNTPYARAMDAIIRNLVENDAFAPLRRTLDFAAARVEHTY
jgi:hypothetical protein